MEEVAIIFLCLYAMVVIILLIGEDE